LYNTKLFGSLSAPEMRSLCRSEWPCFDLFLFGLHN